jgi:hypothetical protein
MEDLRADPRLVADLDQLIETLQKAVALTAQVRGVQPVVLRDHRAQPGQLVGVGEAAGRVDERRADAEGTLLHLLRHDAAQQVVLGLGQATIVEAAGDDAQVRAADGAGDVHRDAGGRKVVEPLGQPLEVDAQARRVVRGAQLHELRRTRARGEGFAEHLCCHALEHVGGTGPVLLQRAPGVAQGVDEARYDGETCRVELGRISLGGYVADRHDLVSRDHDVCDPSRRTAAVVDRATADHQ